MAPGSVGPPATDLPTARAQVRELGEEIVRLEEKLRSARAWRRTSRIAAREYRERAEKLERRLDHLRRAVNRVLPRLGCLEPDEEGRRSCGGRCAFCALGRAIFET